MLRPEAFSERKSSSMMTMGKRKRSMAFKTPKEGRSVGPAAGSRMTGLSPYTAPATGAGDGLEHLDRLAGDRRRAGGRRADQRHVLSADARARCAGRRRG